MYELYEQCPATEVLTYIGTFLTKEEAIEHAIYTNLEFPTIKKSFWWNEEMPF